MHRAAAILSIALIAGAQASQPCACSVSGLIEDPDAGQGGDIQQVYFGDGVIAVRGEWPEATAVHVAVWDTLPTTPGSHLQCWELANGTVRTFDVFLESTPTDVASLCTDGEWTETIGRPDKLAWRSFGWGYGDSVCPYVRAQLFDAGGGLLDQAGAFSDADPEGETCRAEFALDCSGACGFATPSAGPPAVLLALFAMGRWFR